jgi:hypothetical protein
MSVVSSSDTTCGGNRAGTGALGECHTFTYLFGPDAGGSQGWAGVVWQYPADNWGAGPGYAIPAGATKVRFSVRGETGAEKVTFSAGGTGNPTSSIPCVDTVNGSAPKMLLPTAWTQVVMPLTGTYAGGVIDGFSLAAAALDQQASVTSITFYVDDIEWLM